MKPLLVGEMPSRTGDRYWEFPLSGAVAQTLCQMAGIPPEENGSRFGRWTWALYDEFDCINAIERHGPWDLRAASYRLLEEIEDDREVVVLLGRRAQHAYATMYHPAKSPVDGIDYYKWVEDINSPTARRRVIVLPHPSALNRLYHQDEQRKLAGRALQMAIEEAKNMSESRI